MRCPWESCHGQTQDLKLQNRSPPQTSSLARDRDVFRQRVVWARVHRPRKGGEVRGAAEEITGREEDPHTTAELKERAVMARRPASVCDPSFLFAQRRSRRLRSIFHGLILP